MSRSKSTHLYIVSCRDRLKVGVTNNIDRRIKQLQTGNPDQIVLEFIEERIKPHKAEKYIHRHFQCKNVGGEWFEGITVHDVRVQLMLFHDQE